MVAHCLRCSFFWLARDRLAPESLADGVEGPFATAVGEPAAAAAGLEAVVLKGRPPEAGGW
jgi:hypothetical protein